MSYKLIQLVEPKREGMITNSKRVVYWIGAGASYNALPIVTEFEHGIQAQQQWLATMKYTTSGHTAKLGYLEELTKLAHHGSTYGTVDTYARALHLLENQDELSRLKLHLSMFFVLECLRQRKSGTGRISNESADYSKPDLIDKRYLGLLAVLMESRALAANVQFISWNYDLQIQQALCMYLGYTRISQLHDHDGRGCIMPKVGLSGGTPPTSPFLIQLNGTAGNANFKPRMRLLYDEVMLGNREKFVNELFELYTDYDKRDQSMLYSMRETFRFAWEPGNETVLDCAYRAMENASVLVIIGYSFPSFNRSVDKELFKRFCQTQPGSKYVVIQNPNLNPDTFRRIMGSIGVNIGSVQEETNLAQFHIPPELF